MDRTRYRVLAVCGSLQAESSNLRLLQRAIEIAPSHLMVDIVDHLRHLPLFNPDLLHDDGPAAVQIWRAAISACDGILVACPEYGHSLPGVLKNGIDWLIGTGEFYHKPVAITAAVGSPERGLLGLAALKQTLLAVDAAVIWDQPIALPDADEPLRTLFSQLVDGIRKVDKEAQ
jgi:chromate reductase, NAD(P)H dehydrogenase (quinone)